MFKNQISHEVQEIKRIRVYELGLTQREVATKGLSRDTLSKIESGSKELSPSLAKIISERFTELGYIVSQAYLLGIEDNTINDKISRFANNPSAYFKEIDSLLENLDDKKSVDIILKVIHILRKDIYKDNYSDLALKYALRLERYTLDQYTYVRLHLDFISIYVVLGYYSRAILVSNSIKDLLYELKDDDKVKYYLSTANAYYLSQKYSLALDNICELKKMKLNKITYLKTLTLESSILTKEKKFEDSIKLNKEIIIMSSKSNMKDYIANSKSNISYMYMELGLIDKAEKYLNDAFALYNYVTIQCKSNLLNNKFYLTVKKQNLSMSLFKKLIITAIKAKDFAVINENIELIVNYGVSLKKDIKFFKDIVCFLKKYTISLNPDLKLVIINYICKKSKKTKEIELITQIIEQ